MANKKAAATEQRAGKPTDPVFRLLVEHAESVRTEHGIMAMRRLGRELDAEIIQMAIHEDGNLYIGIYAKNGRHYSAWHYPDGLTTVENYETTTDETGEKSWTDIDRYSSRDGVTMANGITREGGA